ncbi:piggyBac transposable element-derived protein 3-like [Leptopilina boulardi]|uniref:piggyBac transposable element-derived protein 3-like n=1 Tax=Leptopilina boulardi TaxID=63433 RepID=UPI0021F55313|nr:piggyBac transposable element-derived protein 3-like [Leptopilina boulardi]
MEGDISDVDLSCEESDEENDIFIHRKGILTDAIEDSQSNSTTKIGLKIETMGDESESDTEDDTPLSNRLRVKSLRWKSRDIKVIDCNCNIKFARPIPEIPALRYFKQFLTTEIIHHLTIQTNLYSIQKSGISINVTEKEIEQFFGIHILSGIVKVPSIKCYWSDPTRFSIIADFMTQKRFFEIRTYIHFNDNSKIKSRDHENYDRLYKIRPFIDALKKNLSKLKNEEYNSVDEVIIPLRGHNSSLNQYIRGKAYKHQKSQKCRYNCPCMGFKMFARFGKSGILYDFEFYLGRDVLPSTSGLGLNGDIVLRLCDNLSSSENYKILIDSKFNSHSLIVALKERGLFALGTIRPSKLPGCVFRNYSELKKRVRGAYDFRTEQSTNIIALKWWGMYKPVYIASSYSSIHPLESITSWSSTRKKYREFPVPHLLFEYNQCVGGVDLHNMLLELYRIDIRAKRYYLRIIFNLIDSCLVNSWLLYRRHCDLGSMKCKSLLDFRSEIAYGLLQTKHS